MRYINQLIQSILPSRCAVTGEIVPTQGALSPTAWASLHFISDPKCGCCGLPFETIVAGVGDILCGPCLADPKPYRTARSAIVYNDESRKLILAFKHGDQTHLDITFAPWLKNAGSNMLADADLIVPVPLHWRRMVSRRYNQSALLVRGLSKLTGIPAGLDVLKRVRHTPTQGHLSAIKRHENVRKAFLVEEKNRIAVQSKNIVLIDDVFTTGATIEECAKALQAAGAARVDVLTVARVVRPDSIS